MKRHIEEEIDKLKERILFMGGICEEMIHLSVRNFIERNVDTSEEVFKREEAVNKLQMEVDDTSARILALHQPEATDLRTIIAAMKINSDLERIADQAVNISQTCHFHLSKEAPVKTLIEIPRMATIAQDMLKEALDAFAKRDVNLAQSVLKRDEEEDTLKAKALNEVIGMIRKNPDHAKQHIDHILIAKNLEKIGDHATNIAEDVIFMVMGKDIRHQSQQEPSQTSH